MKKTIKSFDYAIQGIKLAVKNERNMRIHIAIIILVLISAFGFSVTKAEWALLIFAIGLVISAEIFNTAIEKSIDLTTKLFPESYEKAGIPKDLSAGAVLVTAITAAIIGFIVFVPYILKLIGI